MFCLIWANRGCTDRQDGKVRMDSHSSLELSPSPKRLKFTLVNESSLGLEKGEKGLSSCICLALRAHGSHSREHSCEHWRPSLDTEVDSQGVGENVRPCQGVTNKCVPRGLFSPRAQSKENSNYKWSPTSRLRQGYRLNITLQGNWAPLLQPPTSLLQHLKQLHVFKTIWWKPEACFLWISMQECTILFAASGDSLLYLSTGSKNLLWTGETAQQVKMLAAKPPEFQLWDPCGRRESTTPSCPLMYKHTILLLGTQILCDSWCNAH